MQAPLNRSPLSVLPLIAAGAMLSQADLLRFSRMSPDEIASEIVGGGTGVGNTMVHPQYLGAPVVYPQYVGAPVQEVNQPAGNPIQYQAQQYSAGDVSYMGLGSTVILAGATFTPPTFKPLRPITPQKFGFPSTVQGLLVNQIAIGGIGLFASTLGVPIEMFSEVSTFPQLRWPTIDPAVGIDITVTNPTGGNLTLSGAIYGTQVRI